MPLAEVMPRLVGRLNRLQRAGEGIIEIAGQPSNPRENIERAGFALADLLKRAPRPLITFQPSLKVPHAGINLSQVVQVAGDAAEVLRLLMKRERLLIRLQRLLKLI